MKSETRMTRANCKPPALRNFRPFPLAPALSLREREHRRQRIRKREPLGVVVTRSLVLPLPEGEGRGEGERIVRIPERCHFYNRLTQFKAHPTRLKQRWSHHSF